ncbi:hypothetical protein DUI87_20709 [Hirundo rustica rustica]|uniref:RNA-directed DNA polymerase n=1 Tax=Hirundo rustica rustica TaxID=333673 RepID=A0A3M0JXE3_HIRRU|nr:hypothetical protein DUI87_20709 [Hirundo rustica rustica]
MLAATAIEERPTQKLNWKTDSPVWVEQWPLIKEKLKVLQELVDEQLAKDHIVEATSLWNSPVFVIKKANKGFKLQEEKIQRMPPWKYLGLEIGKRTIVPQKLVVKNNIRISADVQQLCGSLNWQQFYVMHIRSHTNLPGFIAEGNRKADALAVPVEMATLPNIFGQAKISHQLFRQNAPGLVRQFHLTWEQAQAIVATCPLCQKNALPALSAGANPRGLKSCEVWQMYVTHIMSFGRQRYVHVSVDTFSGAVYASAHTGEKSSDAMKHLIQAFSFLGIPKSIKTDNGPMYTSKEFRSFLQQWGVEHKTGIPYSPTVMALSALLLLVQSSFAALPFSQSPPLCAAIPTWSNMTMDGSAVSGGRLPPGLPLLAVLLFLLQAKYRSQPWRQCLLGLGSEVKGGCSISEGEETIMVLQNLFCCLLQPPPQAENPEEKDASKNTEITVLSHNKAKSKF